MAFFGKIFSTTLLFPILKISKTSTNIIIFLSKCVFKNSYITILATENFALKIGNSRIVIVCKS